MQLFQSAALHLHVVKTWRVKLMARMLGGSVLKSEEEEQPAGVSARTKATRRSDREARQIQTADWRRAWPAASAPTTAAAGITLPPSIAAVCLLVWGGRAEALSGDKNRSDFSICVLEILPRERDRKYSTSSSVLLLKAERQMKMKPSILSAEWIAKLFFLQYWSRMIHALMSAGLCCHGYKVTCNPNTCTLKVQVKQRWIIEHPFLETFKRFWRSGFLRL